MPSSAGRLQPRPRPTWKAGCCCEPSPKREIAMLRRSFLALAAATTAGLAFAGATAPAAAQDKFIIVQSTTSTQNSGLFDYMLPLFTEKTGIEVRVVAVGRSEEHTSELQSLMRISYAVFCLKKKTTRHKCTNPLV